MVPSAGLEPALPKRARILITLVYLYLIILYNKYLTFFLSDKSHVKINKFFH